METNPKYQDILHKGKELFWKYGIKKVSIEEICKESGVSKMTYYKFFPNKIALAKTILVKLLDESLAKFKEIVNADIDFTEKVKGMFVLKMEASKDFSIDFINDVYKNPDFGLQKLMEEKGALSFNLFIQFLNDSQKQGLIRNDIKIDFIMYYFNHMSSLFDDANLVSKYDSPQDLVMEAMNFLFYGLMSKK